MIWTNYIFILLIATITSLVMLLGGDFVAKKYLGLGDPIVYDSHPLWGYSPRENRKYKRFDGDIVSINNVGARGLQEWREDGANILFLGDSVTYGGSYINDENTFVSISCSDLTNWSCHNAGVNAYGILNMIARSRYDARIKDAPIRVFTFISGDFDRGLQDSNTAHFILRNPPNYLSGLWEIMNFIAASINPKSWFGKQSDIQDREILNQSQFENRQFALDIFTNELERLESIGLKFLIVHSPSVAELKNNELIRNNFVLSKLQKHFPDEYISLVDPIKKNLEKDKKGIYKDEVHFEDLGHEIIGNFLAPRISSLTN